MELKGELVEEYNNVMLDKLCAIHYKSSVPQKEKWNP